MVRLMRFVKFNAVGALGMLVQLTVLWVLIESGRVDYLVATIAAVFAAIVHNFLWHVRWTWRDREAALTAPVTAFTRFVLSNGAVSLVGNVVVMAILTGGLHLAPLFANLIAIGVCGLINFWIGDLYVFPQEVLE